jgi:signal transduction histidine kinase
MHVKFKLQAAILLVAITALVVVYFATTIVIAKAFDKIETQSIQTNTAQAVDALDNGIDQLQFKAADWASWDDTYAFVVNHNNAFIKSNLQSGSLNSLGIDYMLFYNDKQVLVQSKAVDADSGKPIAVPPELLDAFKPGSKLLASKETSVAKGLLPLSDRTVQFVALPILTSESTGPLHGTLVFAFDLTKDETAKLSALTHLSVNYYRLDDPNQPADVKAAIGRPTEQKSATVVQSPNEIVGYQTVNDAYGNPGLVARVSHTRDIHQTAAAAVKRFIIIIGATTIAAFAVMTFLLITLQTRDHTIALKNEFFSIANHELRTPLTVIRNYAQLMKFQFSKTVKDPKFDHMADSIDQAGAQLIGVVNVYLDAARLETGKIPFQAQPFQIAELAKALAPQLTATAKAKGVSVVMDCPDTLPAVMGDRDRVQQVLLNLFGNAMKFTDTGTITIKAEVVGNKMAVYVTDTGRGMDQAAQNMLFKRFSQVESKDALRGSGLGLFISKKLIEQMGGTIQVVSSAPGIGSSLSFTLPLAPAAPAAPAAATIAPQQS